MIPARKCTQRASAGMISMVIAPSVEKVLEQLVQDYGEDQA
jgi:hypothetical protein